MAARGWDWICSWEAFVDAGNLGNLAGAVAGLRITWGAGQVTTSGIIQLGQNSAAGAGFFAGWLFDGADPTRAKGVAPSPWPLSAGSIAMVPYFRVDSTDVAFDIPFHLLVDVTLSPRGIQ
jgi:hypothetical protein